MPSATLPVVHSPVDIDIGAEVEKMAQEEQAALDRAFLVPADKPDMSFGSVRQRFAAGTITEGQLVDMLVARGISLLDANEMADDELVTQLTIGGTTLSFRAFETIVGMPQFSKSAMDALRNGPDIVDILCSNVKEDMRADGVLPG